MRKMSRRRTARVALITAAGVVSAGAITMLALPANAATPNVTFDGRCSTLASKSAPDQDEVRTQLSSASDKTAEVMVTNHLGTSATPYVDGQPVKGAVLEDGESATLWFASGSSKVTMVPKCGLLGINTALLSKDHDAATVAVAQAPKESTQDGSGQQPGSGSGSDSGSRSGSDSTAGEESNAGSRPDAPKDPVARGARPPKDMEGGEVGDGASVDDEGDAAGAPAGDDNNRNSAAGRDKAGLVSTSHSGPGTTTLALIALICLLGVAAAALRTIVVSRAARVSSI